MQRKKRINIPGLTSEQQGKLTMIYEKYYEQMYRQAYHILRNRQDAEDAVHEAFYHVCCHADVFSSPESDTTAALIYVYNRNVAINHYHKKKRQNALICSEQDTDQMVPPLQDDLATLIDREETAARIKAAVDALDAPYRQVIVMKYYEHKRNCDIAAQLDLPRNVVNSRMFRAKKALRKLLEQDEDTERRNQG